MNYDEVINHYSARVSELSAQYESKTFEEIHGDWLGLLPAPPASVLDIGSGTGRDAAALAQRGYDVVAAEPADSMIAASKQLHSDKTINWLQDRLPDLKKTMHLGSAFDVILLSAVWMHVVPNDRVRVFRKLATLLKPGGLLVISLRTGPHHIDGSTYPVSVSEIEQLATQRGLLVAKVSSSADLLGRAEISWETVVLRLPDDGTGALPLLRNIIINDRKSSTYKLALLRALVRIADGANSLVEISNDEFVRVPLGLVALYWIRLYKPLVENGVPQGTGSGLGFVKDAFRGLSRISPFELRVGADFHGSDSLLLTSAIRDAASTIKKMPAVHITYPNTSEQIFKTGGSASSIAKSPVLKITPEFLWSFGDLQVPLGMWQTLTRHACWIEPALVFEWTELMKSYGEAQGQSFGRDKLMELLVWLDPERDTTLVRALMAQVNASGVPVYCVWSGRKLKVERFDVDHCFPFAAWPCNDLWNLLPATKEANNSKSDKLVTLRTLNSSRERIAEWWHHAYFNSAGVSYTERFSREAQASLPLIDLNLVDAVSLFDNIFEAMYLKRAGLKQNQNLVDWDFGA